MTPPIPPVDRAAAARAIEAFLRAIGRDPDRDPNLAGTGARVTDAFVDELCDGYAVDVAALLAANVVAGEGGLVVVREVGVTTMCPHHLLPAMGTATVAFAPGGKLVGIGALVKLVDAFAHRLTLQEAIAEGVAGALMDHVEARAAGCRLVMRHACMIARGERQHGAEVETVALRGAGEARSAVERALFAGGGA